jgi:cyclic pyranopterin phosphate synthase
MGQNVSQAASDAAGTTGGFSHLDGAGRARMVDVTGKAWTLRRAVARCRVKACDEALAALGTSSGSTPAGMGSSWAEVVVAARMAGIQAAKRTAALIPLCHPLTLSDIDVRLAIADGGVDIESEAEVVGPTGVEMEALTSCAFAALSIMAALRRADPEASIEDLGLWHKSGGRSGTWVRQC